MRRPLLALPLLLLLLAAAAYWLAGREATLRWALAQVAAASDGRLQFAGVGGNLLGSVRVAQGRFSSPEAEVTARRVALDFSLLALLQRQLRIDVLQAEAVVVKLVPSDEPLQPPASLVLPIAIEVTRIEIGRIDIQRGDLAVVLRQLQARFASSGRAHALELKGVDSPWGRARATLNLQGRAPFALAGRVDLIQPDAGSRLPNVQLDLRGPLAEIRAALTARASWLQAGAEAVIQPFQAIPVAGLKAQLQRLDLHALDPSLPKGILTGQITASQTREDRFAGHAELSNRNPGTLAQDSLPLTALAARFAVAPDSLLIDDVKLALQRGAAVTGKARLDRDGLSAQLSSKGLDLQAFHERMAPTRLAGSLAIRADRHAQQVQARMADARQRYEIDAVREGDRIKVRQASIRNGDSRIEVQGDLTAKGAWPFTAQARLVNLDPAAFGDFPAARINATLAGSGRLNPGLQTPWQARLEAEISDSRYRQQALSGRMQATVTPDRVADSLGEIDWGGSHAAFRGALGARGDRLDVDFSMADLKPFAAGWAGQAKGTATLTGSLRHPGIALKVQASGVSGPDRLSIGNVALSANAARDLAAPLVVEARLGKVRLDDLALDQVTLSVSGTGRAHRGDLGAAGKDLALTARLAGGFNPDLAWRGQVQQFALDRPRQFRLESPASLAMSRSGFELGRTRLSSGRAQFDIDGFLLTATELRTAGRFSGLPVAMLGLPPDSELRSDQLLGGDWQITATDRFNGHLKLWHESGGWTLGGPEKITLAPTRGRLEARVKDNHLALQADLSLKDGSQFDLQLATQVGRQGRAWTIAAEAPLSLQAKGTLTSLAWLGPLLHQDLTLDGGMTLDIAAQGNWKQPRISGRMQGQGIEMRHFPSGVYFSDGTLQARLSGEQVILEKLELKNGEGRLKADGRARLWGKPDLHLHFQGERLALMERKDLDLDTNLEGDLTVDQQGAKLTGKVKVNRGMLVLGGSYAPALSPDVRIKGRTAQSKSERELGIGLDVTVDLGDDFRVRSSEKGQLLGGRLPFQSSGLRARVVGQIRMQGERGKVMKAKGEIRVVDGSYYLLGQRLDIERGNILFDGPLLNPVLDISAVREKPQMKAGMSITGSAENPRARLFSEPEVPDQEKLSWLLFGRGGQPVDTSLGAVTGGTQTMLTSFGFQLSEKLSVAYEQGTTGTENFVTFYSTLTDKLSVEARTGDEIALRLFYTFTLGRAK